MRSLLTSLLLLALFPSAQAQFKNATPAGEAPGPWLFGTIGVGQNTDKTPKTTALKGLAIKLGDQGQAAICYDLDLCRVAGAWTGGKFTTPMNLMSRGEYPTALGEVAFTTSETAGFRDAPKEDAEWKDARSEPFGPIADARYRGLYRSGQGVVLKWDVHGTEVLEAPSYREGENGWKTFTRRWQVARSPQPLLLVLAEVPEAGPSISSSSQNDVSMEIMRGWLDEHQALAVGYSGLAEGVSFRVIGHQLCLEIPALTESLQFVVAVGVHPRVKEKPVVSIEGGLAAAEQQAEAVMQQLNTTFNSFNQGLEKTPIDFEPLMAGGPARWPDEVETTGELAKTTEKDAYVVDTIKLPDPNPWDAPLFLGGFDFFSDGRAAVCTFHGDVFIVSGLNAGLEHVRWKRYATGLYHALGLKIVNDEIYVTGRDGITRLRDLNGDGEADFYEAFNWDVKVTKSFHEFVFDLQTDPAGNFYFAKAGPVKNGGRGFDQICEHHGCLFRVSPDGKKLGVVATGFRAPNGIGVGPNGEMTTGDNEGTWTPVCRLNSIKDGGFYGVVPLAHWPNDPPTDYDKPLCWLPKRIDNSSGSQVWVTSRKWGPWQGQMLHLSYGTCSLFGVMSERVHVPNAPECCDSVMQGGVTAFPLKFQSGIMRARFSPADGQLYVAGLRGWQTTGLKNGAFQRVRYTGQPVRMPIALAARKGGIELKFTTSLDTQQASDPENWSVEVWNYVWSSAYGSPEVSTLEPTVTPGDTGKEGEGQFSKAQMTKSKHDVLAVKSVSIGTDDRTVFLEIPDLKPVMQMSIKYRLKSADGVELKGEVVNTVNALAE